MKLPAIFSRKPKRDARWYQTRVQYDAIDRRVRRQLAAAAQVKEPTPKLESTAVSKPAIVGLAIVTVAAYCIGLNIGAPHGVSATITDTLIESRARVLEQVIHDHPVTSVLGDSWSLVPLSAITGRTPDQVGLESCGQVSRGTKSDFKRSSFAYVVSDKAADPVLRDCSRADAIAAFGQPTAITIIAGTVDQPLEEVLFYDTGVNPDGIQRPRKPVIASNQVQARPVGLQELTNKTCAIGRTILQIVAHEDDDLLFMNPDLYRGIQEGACIRTIYLTAGDAGSSKFYWLGRERGSEAAYAQLGGIDDTWTDQTLRFGQQRFATVASPTTDPRFSLIFMHLPDGKPDGQGFESSEFSSLAKLVSGEKQTLRSVDRQSTYSYKSLIASLTALMNLYQPTEIRTQLPYNDSVAFTDHSDHMTSGQLASSAAKSYQATHPEARVVYYVGYPIRAQPANVEGDDLYVKEQAFFTYANYDGAVCTTEELCMARGDYGEYLQRQYSAE